MIANVASESLISILLENYHKTSFFLWPWPWACKPIGKSWNMIEIGPRFAKKQGQCKTCLGKVLESMGKFLKTLKAHSLLWVLGFQRSFNKSNHNLKEKSFPNFKISHFNIFKQIFLMQIWSMIIICWNVKT